MFITLETIKKTRSGTTGDARSPHAANLLNQYGMENVQRLSSYEEQDYKRLIIRKGQTIYYWKYLKRMIKMIDLEQYIKTTWNNFTKKRYANQGYKATNYLLKQKICHIIHVQLFMCNVMFAIHFMIYRIQITTKL